MTTDTIIRTERLNLRTWSAADAEDYLIHLNTPEARRWLGPPITRDEAMKMIERVNDHQRKHGFGFWLIERAGDGAMLGFCGLKRVDAEGTDLTGEFEIGWSLRQDCWGLGYAKEAALAALDRAFATHGASRVVAFTVQDNKASWGLMERLGMTRRPDLDYHDPAYGDDLNPTIVYMIQRPE